VKLLAAAALVVLFLLAVLGEALMGRLTLT
jgi:hypothetical protein